MSSQEAPVVAGLNETPSGERVHIGFFGVRNAGKSSLVNAVTGQDLAVVSATPGTTTDPVRKAMELLPAGPVLIVDTPGIDDAGELGDLRVEKALGALGSTDVAVLVVDSTVGLRAADLQLLEAFRSRRVPYAVAWNKSDLRSSSTGPDDAGALPADDACPHAEVDVSALTGAGVQELKEALAGLAERAGERRVLVSDLVSPGDAVVLVVPVDSAAPKGRLILPQQQVIRDCIECGAHAMVTGVEGLAAALASLVAPPKLVITDSQAFGEVSRIVDPDIALTSFSILMARYKGTLATQVGAVESLRTLSDDDEVLITEGCTHHRQCDDIGTVKLPRMIRAISGANPRFSFTSGRDFPTDLAQYAAVVHCGGCMLNAREVQRRAHVALAQGVPFANYGMVIAQANGILERALAPIADSLDD